MTMSEHLEIVAHHEAGHAVAAVMRGGSLLLSVELSPGGPERDGITWARAKQFDSAFMSWSGPWAEARYQWGERALDAEDEDGATFSDYVAGVFLAGGRDDAGAIRQSRRAEPYQVPAELIAASERVWSMELERAWPAVQEVARLLIAGSTVTDVEVRRLTDQCL